MSTLVRELSHEEYSDAYSAQFLLHEGLHLGEAYRGAVSGSDARRGSSPLQKVRGMHDTTGAEREMEANRESILP